MRQNKKIVYLAGDIGGTKTHLALYEEGNGRIKDGQFPSQNYSKFSSILNEFLDGEILPDRTCLGVAGPVEDHVVKTTNLPWVMDALLISKEVGIEKVALINDLEANAYGIRVLEEKDFFVLNQGQEKRTSNQALISAGTGLGEAGLLFHQEIYHPFACEGGHTDFAPKTPLEDQLLCYLRKKWEHVSYERILSGSGLIDLYRFLSTINPDPYEKEILSQGENGAHLITEKGLSRTSSTCYQALELFTSIYGAEAGNLALKMLALGGVFVGGGIAPKMLPILKKGGFLRSFIEKGRFKDLLSQIPIRVILNDQAALLGAFYYAQHCLTSSR